MPVLFVRVFFTSLSLVSVQDFSAVHMVPVVVFCSLHFLLYQYKTTPQCTWSLWLFFVHFTFSCISTRLLHSAHGPCGCFLFTSLSLVSVQDYSTVHMVPVVVFCFVSTEYSEGLLQLLMVAMYSTYRM